MMNQTLRLFWKQILFWIVQFWLFRLVFLIWLGPWGNNIPNNHMFFSMFAGWKLDLSVIAYLSMVPFLISVVFLFSGIKILKKLFTVYFVIVITATVIIQTGNIAIYKFWGTMLNNRALAFTMNPTEIFASLTGLQIMVMALSLLLMIFLCFRFFAMVVLPAVPASRMPLKPGIVWHLLVLALTVLLARGGFQQIPVNESAAFYSQHNTLNHIATNSIWHLGNNLRQSSVTATNPYAQISAPEAEKIVDALFNRSALPTINKVIDITKQPNVVIIMLESWTADIIEPMGGLSGVSPFFSELCKDGLLFTGVYSSGFRTDQAMVSVISGFPAQPNKSIIRFPDKTQKLPALSRTFRDAGYHTSLWDPLESTCRHASLSIL